ncbi:TBC1 domain family member 10B [Ceratobasidium sp. AG-Ba]|nr:TBC1 domain family member 10B [Ceratobasidium sp. AG-Ba]
MSEGGGGNSDGSESDYGQQENYGLGAAAQKPDYGDDDASLYRDDSLEDSRGTETLTKEVHGGTTPIPNNNGRLSPGSIQSRSSTPPFGFELEPTVHHGTDLDAPDDGASSSHGDDRRPASVVGDEPRPQSSTSNLPPTSQTAGSESGDESDYGEPEPPSASPPVPQPASPVSFISKHGISSQNQNLEDEEFEPVLPPVRPPYHRASSSMHSIVSSNGGGYYDDAIYDHYRYSHVSMAARSMRFSIIGNGGEMPPLPAGGGVAPLNLQREGSVSVSGSQASPRSFGPMSPRSPLGQGHGEPASPRSVGSPLAAGAVMQTQMETKPEPEPEVVEAEAEVKTKPAPSLNTTRLAPITTSGLTPASPGALTIPLSPTPSAGPPSPALSNLASSLRQAIEQQRSDTAETEPEPTPESPDESESIDEDKPILLAPIMVQGMQSGSPIANLQRRPSQFAPHPNAPKTADHFPPASTAPAAPAPVAPNMPNTESSHMRLHDALQLVVQRLRAGGPRGGTPTIHGRTHSELGLSSGPVPISFLFDPDGRSVSYMAGRMVGGAQRSASMNVNMHGGAGNGPGTGTGEYVGSKLRPRSRSFSGMPQEQADTLRSAGEPGTPTTESEFKPPPVNMHPPSSPLAQPPTPSPPQPASAPMLTPIIPSIPAQVSDSPLHSPTSASSSSPQYNESIRGLRHAASNTMMRVGLGSISIPSSPVPQRTESPVSRQRQSHEVSRPPAETHDSSSASPRAPINSKTSLNSLKMPRETPTTPLSPVGSVQLAEETVHFHDMDFDMVKPKRSRVSLIRTSEDAGSRVSHQSDRPGDDSHTSTPTSPTATSPSHQTRESVPASLVPLSSGHNSLTSPAEIAAHVSREQRWITTMQTIPSSSIRRNKKIKKLLLEGVPASVRGVVWLYLSDSKARRMEGLYSQLCKRGKVPTTPEILKDLESCFPAQPHLQAPGGPVVTMLQAYLTMIPDIAYSQGLCQIAGNLLMNSPEEDAFWTFVALMDNYLRGYYAVNSLHMEADSVFFAKTLESNDAQLAAKLFKELGLGAIDFCKPWILSGFHAIVPYEYSCRIWDIFLFEGAPFLFRAHLLACSPSLPCLPSDPDQLIALAYAVKFKEDDMRKVRPKIEAQLRKESGINRPGAIRDALKK